MKNKVNNNLESYKKIKINGLEVILPKNDLRNIDEDSGIPGISQVWAHATLLALRKMYIPKSVTESYRLVFRKDSKDGSAAVSWESKKVRLVY